MSAAAPVLRRGRPRHDAPPRLFRRAECAMLAGVSERTITSACNLYDTDPADGLRYTVRRGPVLRVAAPDLLAWVARRAGRGRRKEGTP